MKGPSWPRIELRLRTSLMLLMVLAAALTFGLVGGAILSLRLPQVELRAQEQLRARALSTARLLDLDLSGIEAQLRPLSHLLASAAADPQPVLDALTRADSPFVAVFLLEASGRVQSLGLRDGRAETRGELRGADFSGNPLFRAMQERGSAGNGALWSDKYLSTLAGTTTVALALPVDRRLLIAELDLGRMLTKLEHASKEAEAEVLIVDGRGQWLASTRSAFSSTERHLNYANMASVQALDRGEAGPGREMLFGETRLISAVRPALLGWSIIASAPAGWGQYSYRVTVLLVLAGFGGALAISMLLAPWFATLFTRPVQALIARAHAVADGDYLGAWPGRGPIRELNQLGADLARMVKTIQTHGERLRATLDSAPAVSVQWYSPDGRVLYWNQASESMYGYSASQALGAELREQPLMYLDGAQVQAFLDILATLDRDGGNFGPAEFELRHRDGQPVHVLASVFAVPGERGQKVFVCMDVDITAAKRNEAEILRLNQGLEARVAERTEALTAANEELQTTIEYLKATQQQLVRSEKLAALGRLVAGVAHELNTPLGNGLMVITTLRESLRALQAEMSQGLRRSTLDSFVAQAEQGSDIAERNLRRAAELVANFKQVAVDQTSAQRRQFTLKEIVGEALLMLSPTTRKTPHRLRTVLAENISMDSYPGALVQVLSNLVENALVHGLAECAEGEILICTEAGAPGQARIVISDNGCGIPPEHLGRIFDPFFTTRMGRGGSGLGLHVVHELVGSVLGGRISVYSSPGAGARFVIELPLAAPLQVTQPGDL
ncbi:PAS domain S-box protein [Pelomonas sp. V22]|uniref:ATP-binding protein n=1 Tax=Pelomonas sp. V22 TaxID=2822139 RepID=UPI0024A7EDAA|nr:ATP-binding protein [Pelomonas sp. V22]MDI4634857.1 PAS domain S-box protein [Pelomonas sp. V22]